MHTKSHSSLHIFFYTHFRVISKDYNRYDSIIFKHFFPLTTKKSVSRTGTDSDPAIHALGNTNQCWSYCFLQTGNLHSSNIFTVWLTAALHNQ